jgi:chloramphenicol-sensitive protein RarD
MTTSLRSVPPNRSGLLYGVLAYLIWGLFPLFWPLLEPAKPVEILAHRVVWSFVFIAIVLAATIRLRWVRAIEPRQYKLLAIAAVLVTVNWGTFIYGVNSGRVVETSLGYFINPLVTVALAVFVLRERLSAAQGIALAIAAVAVGVLTLDYGRPPYIALTLACTFGLYGLIKNRAKVDGTQSLAIETAVLLIPALIYLAVLQAGGHGSFTAHGPGHAALIAAGGVATAVPLMLFGAAAIRIPLSTLGLLQYLTPTMQFGIGVLVDGEPMPLSRLAGFALVWVALIIFSTDALRSTRRARMEARAAAAAAPAR